MTPGAYPREASSRRSTAAISETRSLQSATARSAPSGKCDAVGTAAVTAAANASPEAIVMRGSSASRNPATGVATTGRPTAWYS